MREGGILGEEEMPGEPGREGGRQGDEKTRGAGAGDSEVVRVMGNANATSSGTTSGTTTAAPAVAACASSANISDVWLVEAVKMCNSPSE